MIQEKYKSFGEYIPGPLYGMIEYDVLHLHLYSGKESTISYARGSGMRRRSTISYLWTGKIISHCAHLHAYCQKIWIHIRMSIHVTFVGKLSYLTATFCAATVVYVIGPTMDRFFRCLDWLPPRCPLLIRASYKLVQDGMFTRWRSRCDDPSEPHSKMERSEAQANNSCFGFSSTFHRISRNIDDGAINTQHPSLILHKCCPKRFSYRSGIRKNNAIHISKHNSPDSKSDMNENYFNKKIFFFRWIGSNWSAR